MLEYWGSLISIMRELSAHLQLMQLPTPSGCQTDSLMLELGSCLSVAVLSTQASVTRSRALQVCAETSCSILPRGQALE